MGVVLAQLDKQYGTRPLMASLIGVGAIVFFASSRLDHKGLMTALSLSSGMTIVLMSFGGSLREISRRLQRWSVYAACGVTGAMCGLMLRIFLR